jgi:hypothetical protein
MAFKVVDALVLEQQFVVLANVARCKQALCSGQKRAEGVFGLWDRFPKKAISTVA